MSNTDTTIPINDEKSIIQANLNSSMLLNVLMGIYSTIYVGTMYLYLSRKALHSMSPRIVISAMSLLYVLCCMEFITQWYFLNWSIITNGDTRESIFLQTLAGGPPWTFVLDDFLLFAAILVSDGLLIWRTFHVWGRSLKVVSVPLFLLLAELGLLCTVVALAWINPDSETDPNPNLFNKIESALTFISLGTTLLSTFLIGYRIHSSVNTGAIMPPSSLKRVFQHISILVVESAAVYSLVLLLEAISIVIPVFGELGSPWSAAEYYIESVLIIVTGMAPTVLVARLALTGTSPDSVVSTSTLGEMSGLQFRSQQVISGHGKNKEFDNSVVEEKEIEHNGVIGNQIV